MFIVSIGLWIFWNFHVLTGFLIFWILSCHNLSSDILNCFLYKSFFRHFEFFLIPIFFGQFGLFFFPIDFQKFCIVLAPNVLRILWIVSSLNFFLDILFWFLSILAYGHFVLLLLPIVFGTFWIVFCPIWSSDIFDCF